MAYLLCPGCNSLIAAQTNGRAFNCTTCGKSLCHPTSLNTQAQPSGRSQDVNNLQSSLLQEFIITRTNQTTPNMRQHHSAPFNEATSSTTLERPAVGTRTSARPRPAIPPRPPPLTVQARPVARPVPTIQASQVTSLPSTTSGRGYTRNSSSSDSDSSGSSSPVLVTRSSEDTPSSNAAGSVAGSNDASRARNRNSSHSPVRKKSNTGTETAEASRSKKKTCHSCQKSFTLLGRWKHKCRSCKHTMCANCSRGKWPPQMLPKSDNPRGEKTLRVCGSCQDNTEQFRKALLQGRLDVAKQIYSAGVVQISCPYQIYPEKMYPIHCAAYSGSIETVEWLISNGCKADVVDARGYTPLAVAAVKAHQHLVKHLLFKNISSIKEITDYRVLQNCLMKTFQDLHDMETRLRCLDVGEPKTREEEQAQLELALRESASSEDCPAGFEGDISMPEPSAPAVDDEDDSNECVVCFENPIDCVIVPCGHISCCQECAKQFKHCVVCRAEVKQVVKTYRT